jgi:hypothetical protein
MHQTPLDVLEIATVRGGWPSLVSSRSFRRYQGRPGEIIEKLSPEQRATLREFDRKVLRMSPPAREPRKRAYSG